MPETEVRATAERGEEGEAVTIEGFLSAFWKVVAGTVAALLALAWWKRREGVQAGRRVERQEAELRKAEAFKADVEFLRQRQNERLAREVQREVAEAEARRKADEATTPPEPASQDTEDIIAAARKAVAERGQ